MFKYIDGFDFSGSVLLSPSDKWPYCLSSAKEVIANHFEIVKKTNGIPDAICAP